MKVVCSQSELNAALQLVSRAVATRPTHPVLANVLLTADAGTDRLSLTGFDLNLGIQTSLAANVQTSGAITLPARLLGEIVSRLASDSPVTLASDDGGEQVQLTSLSGSYQMRGMSADDFPELPMVESGMTLKLEAAGLVQALKGTLFASSSDEAKQLLTGVHLRFNDRSLEAAATDGHRLAVLQVDDALVDALHDRGFTIAIESNGTLAAHPGIDWICVSPKAGSDVVQRSGHELKLVWPQPGGGHSLADVDAMARWAFAHHLIQPLDDAHAPDNARAAIALVMDRPQWRLTVQAHKYLGLR